jgi:hypothetical protein
MLMSVMAVRQIEGLVIKAGSYLNTDFEKAEALAKSAIILAGDGQFSRQQFDDYLAVSKAPKSYPNEKIAEIEAIKPSIFQAKMRVNEIANKLMVTNPSFRQNRIRFIQGALQEKYGSTFSDRGGHVQYRSIAQRGDYGKPEIAFQQGLAPQFVAMWLFQSGIINTPYVNDSKDHTGEKVGWTGGISSTTSNLSFAAGFNYAEKYGIQDGWIFAYAANVTASVGSHIQYGSGYSGAENKSNAEAAEEHMVPYIEPESIIMARRVFKDGTLGELKANPNVACSKAIGDIEYLKLVSCETVDELKLIEYLEGKNPRILDDIGIRASIDQEMVGKFSNLTPMRQAFVLELAECSVGASHILQREESGKRTQRVLEPFTDEQKHDIEQKRKTHRFKVASDLRSADFHNLKKRSEVQTEKKPIEQNNVNSSGSGPMSDSSAHAITPFFFAMQKAVAGDAEKKLLSNLAYGTLGGIPV